MFIINYFRYGFDFPNIIERRKEPFIKVFIFFILLVLLSNVPHIISIVKNEGWTISFIEESFNQETPAYGTFNFPDDISIHYYGLDTPNDDEHIMYFGDYMFVINAHETSYDTNLEQILLTEDKIIYIDEENNTLTGSYRGFNDVFDFDSVMLDVDNWQSNMLLFASSLEDGFSQYIIFYSMVTYSGIQILTTTLLVFILSLIIRLFKFGYGHFMTYVEGLKMLVFTLPFPVLLGLVVGLFIDSLTPFIVQFGMGVLTMYVLRKFGKYYFN
jgi:maltodextrin utilization protein YvdJ